MQSVCKDTKEMAGGKGRYEKKKAKAPSGSPEGEGAIRMGKLKQMLMPTPMPKLPNLLKHLEGPGEEEVAVLVIDLDGAVVCQ